MEHTAADASAAGWPWLAEGGGRRKGSRSSDSEAGEGDEAEGGSTATARRSRWGKATGVTKLGPLIPCGDETAIFRVLGLAYVPVHMRFFTDVP